ncbi:CLUMA_CG012857, isoform A [Clunio marinus]|uniref:CLUMA_CG012857, isoform A n=1 Tax=Clunio marinus TaxID=568069 RepID=A0A1J1IIF1_9DIPT|nr:CLUMA_CG012857, isoform A [Clunio marinus]
MNFCLDLSFMKMKFSHDANLVLSSIRHHRDLFSGGSSLGIPDVNTHVGSVIHAFETLAHQRQAKENEETLEKMYKATKPNSNHVKRDSIYKIILPPHSLRQNAVLDDLTKKVVRHQKRKAPVPEPLLINNVSESTASDSMSLDDNGFKSYREMPKFYAKNNKVLPPFPSTVSQGTQIPLKKKLSSNKKERNDNRVSDNFLLLSKTKPDDPYTKSFKKPLKNNLKNTLENDFLRGSTVSQSFIKNVVKKPPSHKISTYEQNFLIDPKRNKDEEKSLDNEVKMRYKQYKSYDDKNFYDKKRNDFQPQATVEL